jgi:hypothetical protein
MAGAQGMMGAAGAGRQAELGALGAQMSAGDIARQIEQAGLGADYEQFMREQQYPLQSLAGLFSTAGLIPAGIGTSTTTERTGGMGPALGTLGKLGMSAASMGAFGPAGMAFGGMGGGMGAGYGAGMGYGGLSTGRLV